MKNKALLWTPRILGILAILFMMMFSMDCFGGTDSYGEQLVCFLMHNIPSFACIAILIVAWKWELIGGLLFILVFIAMGIFFGSFKGNFGSLVVIGPFLLIGVLFILHHSKEKNRTIA